MMMHTEPCLKSALSYHLLCENGEIDFSGWRVEGDFLGWEYDVYEACSSVAHITKELLHWGDTYAIDIADPRDELMALMLVITIDAANCTQNNS